MVEDYLGGEVFVRFDRQDSGNISYGVRSGDTRSFVKTAGEVDPGRVALLRNAIDVAHSCAHPLLVPLRRVTESPHGPLLVYDWFDGELVGVASEHRGDPTSAFQRFRALPALARCLDAIIDLHVALVDAGWIQLAAARTACQADPDRRFSSLRAFRDAWVAEAQ